jgi:hypothetical protein
LVAYSNAALSKHDLPEVLLVVRHPISASEKPAKTAFKKRFSVCSPEHPTVLPAVLPAGWDAWARRTHRPLAG